MECRRSPDSRGITMTIKIRKPSDYMLDGIKVGIGATYHSGSNCYPYYVASLNNGIVGVYRPGIVIVSRDKNIYDIDPFDPSISPTSYRKIYRNNWYDCDKDGNLVVPHRKSFPLVYGTASYYLDPSL